jgi:enoyl-CoA hydratase/carnithine racemase
VPAAETVFQIEPPLAFLTFNRPEARNALTWAMYDALVDACDEVDRTDAVRVLVLRGAGGKAFAAGTDISQFQGFRHADDGPAYEQRVSDVLDRLERVTRPTIAQIAGAAAGAGCLIAATCDIRMASPDSTFGVPIARTLGNCLAGPAFSRLAELVGPGRTKEMLLTGRMMGAADAAAIGLVNRVVAADQLDQAVHETADAMASNAPLTLLATREMARRLAMRTRLTTSDSLDLVERCYTSADFREGVSAFLARRPPRWSGR